MTDFVRKLRILIALAFACAVFLLAARPAAATLTEAQVWQSPAGTRGVLFRPAAVHQYNGSAYYVRATVIQTWAYAPAPLPPPPMVPAVTPGTMTKVFGTGMGTKGEGYIGIYGADTSRAELQLRCQSMSMADTYGETGNPQLVNAGSIQCAIYTHAAGATWSYSTTGTVAPGKMWYRTAASCGNGTGCWSVEVALPSGGTFTAWVN